MIIKLGKTYSPAFKISVIVIGYREFKSKTKSNKIANLPCYFCNSRIGYGDFGVIFYKHYGHDTHRLSGRACSSCLNKARLELTEDKKDVS